MAFTNFPVPTPVFPALPSQAWSVIRKPSQKTEVTIGITGRECQVARQVFPLWEFNLTFGGDAWLRDQTQNQTPYGPEAGFTELQQLSGLFLACQGSYGEFYFNYPDDNSRLGMPGGTTVAGLLTYPLYFIWGTGPLTPPVYLPVQGINTLDAAYLDGTPLSPTAYGPDSTNTQITLTSDPGSGHILTVDLHFYYRCRFLEDMEEYDAWAYNLWQNKTLKFRSVKP